MLALVALHTRPQLPCAVNMDGDFSQLAMAMPGSFLDALACGQQHAGGGEQHGASVGPNSVPVMSQTRVRHRRFPLHYWQPFNVFWKGEYLRVGKRPSSTAISRWYAENAERAWGANAPSYAEVQRHANCFKCPRTGTRLKSEGGHSPRSTEEGAYLSSANDSPSRADWDAANPDGSMGAMMGQDDYSMSMAFADGVDPDDPFGCGLAAAMPPGVALTRGDSGAFSVDGDRPAHSSPLIGGGTDGSPVHSAAHHRRQRSTGGSAGPSSLGGSGSLWSLNKPLAATAVAASMLGGGVQSPRFNAYDSGASSPGRPPSGRSSLNGAQQQLVPVPLSSGAISGSGAAGGSPLLSPQMARLPAHNLAPIKVVMSVAGAAGAPVSPLSTSSENASASGDRSGSATSSHHLASAAATMAQEAAAAAAAGLDHCSAAELDAVQQPAHPQPASSPRNGLLTSPMNMLTPQQLEGSSAMPSPHLGSPSAGLLHDPNRLMRRSSNGSGSRYMQRSISGPARGENAMGRRSLTGVAGESAASKRRQMEVPDCCQHVQQDLMLSSGASLLGAPSRAGYGDCLNGNGNGGDATPPAWRPASGQFVCAPDDGGTPVAASHCFAGDLLAGDGELGSQTNTPRKRRSTMTAFESHPPSPMVSLLGTDAGGDLLGSAQALPNLAYGPEDDEFVRMLNQFGMLSSLGPGSEAFLNYGTGDVGPLDDPAGAGPAAFGHTGADALGVIGESGDLHNGGSPNAGAGMAGMPVQWLPLGDLSTIDEIPVEAFL